MKPAQILAVAGLVATVAATPAWAADERPVKAERAAPEIAITFDDIPAHGPLPPGVTRLQVADEIIAALKRYNVPAFGFLNGGFGADNPQSPKVIAAWRAAGFPLGNHTFDHLNLQEKGAPAFTAEIARNEPMLSAAMKGEDWHWFRFPFLAEGRDAAQRDAVRAYLGQHHYRIAAVTMSFGDYAWNAPYARCKAAGNAKAVAALEASYLDAARDDAKRMRAASQRLYGRDIPYVLLMHLGAFDAHMLPRLLKLYTSMRYTFVSLRKAESDPFYKSATDLDQPGPSPSLEAEAAKAGISLPPPSAPLPSDTLCAGS